MNGIYDMQAYVERAARDGLLVVQPRMGMSSPEQMAQGLRAVADAKARTVGTITLDSYTRVGDHASARRALELGEALNGFPIVAHGAERTAEVAARAGGAMPVQVRHGSALPREIFRTMVRAGLAASEGGPVSYCLPYGRTPLAESVRHWDAAAAELAESAAAHGLRAHLETFGGCMLGQLCPPSLLVALSVLEGMFFAQRGIPTVSLSYAQQTDAVQDVEALVALRRLAAAYLPPEVDHHIVLYTYMGVYPRTPDGAQLLLDGSAEIAVRGGAERLIVKTAAEAHRVPTVAENIAALERASLVARRAAEGGGQVPDGGQVDCTQVFDEARTLVEAVLEHSTDVGAALLRAFQTGRLDIPYCLHQDNLGLTQTRIDAGGRLQWARTGRMPLPVTGPARSAGSAGSAAGVGARQLLTMLRHTADRYDQAALDAAGRPVLDDVPAPREAEPFRVVIVGGGPRGLGVLERLAARLRRAAGAAGDRAVEIYLCDAVQVGAGRIWRSGQDPWFLMNTVAGEVTMFSGPADGGPARPGAGPSLAQWWAGTDPEAARPDAYAPRAVYGRYLGFVLDAVERDLPASVTLHRLRAEVTALVPEGRGYRLDIGGRGPLRADRVVLATGHPRPELDEEQRRLDGPGYIRGDSAADMPLAGVPAGAVVGVVGLGLAFYDVMAALTVGRGGRFVPDGDRLRYLPSGAEPYLVAGSRGGVPVLSRGRNQKTPDWRYRPRVFTLDRLDGLRVAGRLDFRRHALPLLLAEMELVRRACVIRHRYGPDVARRFTERAAAAAGTGAGPQAEVARVAAGFGAGDLPLLDLDALTRPFAGRAFASRAEFGAALTGLLEEDVRQAALGNVDGPLKAALDVLRDVRGLVRTAVDYAGLTPASHRDFVSWFGPANSFLASGPPAERLQQVLALMEAGVLRMVGPLARFANNPLRAWSDQVAEPPVALDLLIDARIPAARLHADPAPLTRGLVATGLLTGYRNAVGGEVYDTDAVAITGPPFHPVRADGHPERGLYVLGVPCERTRWFLQVGISRPGEWDGFVRDADAIAADVLSGARVGQRSERDFERNIDRKVGDRR